MNHRRRIIGHDEKRGFTLIEVLLVLALVAIITTMAWPALVKPFAGRRILTAVDAVRSELCLARVAAMRTGRTYAFRYTVGGNQFRVGPQDESATSYPGSGDASGTPAADATLPRDEKTLPEGVKFFVDDTAASDPTALASDQQMASQGDASDGWSDSILFYPDGTTSNARLLLVNDRNRRLRLVLRGLTGTVTVSEAVAE